MNNQELKDLRDKTIENTTDETTWGGTVKLEEIEEAMKVEKAVANICNQLTRAWFQEK